MSILCGRCCTPCRTLSSDLVSSNFFFFYVIFRSQLAKETKLPIQMHVVIEKFNNV